MNRNYYSKPDLGLSSRVVHWYDIVMLVIIMGALIYVSPPDFSKGVNFTFTDNEAISQFFGPQNLNSEQTEEETKNLAEEKRQQAIARFKEARVPAGYFKEQFRNGNTLNGNYAYTTDEAGEYILYYKGRYERLEHAESSMKTTQKLNESKGAIIDHYIIYNKDNKLYFEIFNGGTYVTDITTDSLIYKDGKPDYEKVWSILLKNEEAEISYIEAATVIAFTEKGMLVGYYDGVAWFLEADDEESEMLIRYGRDGKTKLNKINKSDITPMVIKNQYVILKPNDKDFGIVNLSDGGVMFYKLDEKEALSAYTYILDENDDIMIFAASGKYFRKCIPSDNGAECAFSDPIKNDFSIDGLSVVLSTSRGKHMLWCLSEKEFHYYLFGG